MARFGAAVPLPQVLALGFCAFLLITTRSWEVPQPGGLRFVLLWLGGVAVGLAIVRWWTGRVGWLALLAVAVVVGAILTDVTQFPGQVLRDWHLYLKAADRWTSGQPVYMSAPLTEIPADRTNYPFLYPPMTLPLFALWAALPGPLADGAWLALSGAAILLAMRLFGVRPAWWLPLLSWTPIFQGLYVGNVAVPAALLFAAAPWWGAGLIVGGVFKLYSGLASLWLLRERRFVAFGLGIVLVVALALLTLPITGLELWFRWFDGLEAYRISQTYLPTSLYGLGLPRYLPEPVAWSIAGVAVLGALLVRGRAGLSRFGLATVVASPSLFAHGLIVALPSFLELRPAWAWLAIGITSIVPGPTIWIAIGLAALAWFVPLLGRRSDDAALADPIDLLGPALEVWPTAPNLAEDVEATPDDGRRVPTTDAAGAP